MELYKRTGPILQLFWILCMATLHRKGTRPNLPCVPFGHTAIKWTLHENARAGLLLSKASDLTTKICFESHCPALKMLWACGPQLLQMAMWPDPASETHENSSEPISHDRDDWDPASDSQLGICVTASAIFYFYYGAHRPHTLSHGKHNAQQQLLLCCV